MPASAPPELTGDDDVLADSREELEGLMGDPGTDLPPSLQPRFEEACRLLKVGGHDNLFPAEGPLGVVGVDGNDNLLPAEGGCLQPRQ